MADILSQFDVNRHAFRYFGIICFIDMPGYFPQLEKTIEQNNNLKAHVAAVIDRTTISPSP